MLKLIMVKENVLDTLFPNKKVKWTIVSAIKEAKKYKTRQDFIKGHPGAYTWLLKNGLHKLDLLLPPQRKRWTAESAIAEANKYKSRSEFREKSPGAYQFLIREKVKV